MKKSGSGKRVSARRADNGAGAGRGPGRARGPRLSRRSASRPGQGPPDGNQHSAAPEKVGWVRKFCGKGIFREIWKNRYVVLKGDQLYVSEKEVGGRPCPSRPDPVPARPASLSASSGVAKVVRLQRKVPPSDFPRVGIGVYLSMRLRGRRAQKF